MRHADCSILLLWRLLLRQRPQMLWWAGVLQYPRLHLYNAVARHAVCVLLA